MVMLGWAALIGGNCFLMTVIHFIVDWLCQTHDEAMAKGHNAGVRARHCAIYTLGFLPYFVLVYGVESALHFFMLFVFSGILFFSHFYEDTYKPVIWWFKNVRQPPIFRPESAYALASDEEKLLTYLKEGPLGYILLIAVDQIIHITFLVLIAILMVFIN